MSLEQIVFGSKHFELTEPDGPAPKRTAAWVDPDDISAIIAPDISELPPGMTKAELKRATDQLIAKYHASVENIDVSWAETSDRPITADASDIFSASTKQIPSTSLVIARTSDLYKPKQNQSAILSISFHPGESTAAVLDRSSHLHIISVTGKVNRVQYTIPFAERKQAHCMTYSADGARIFVAGQDGIFQTIDCLSQTAQVSRVLNERGGISSVSCSPNNELLTMISGPRVHFLDASNRQLLKTVTTSDELKCGAFSDEGNFFIAAGLNGRGLVFDCESLAAISRFQEQEMQAIYSIAISRDRVAIGTDPGVLHIFDLPALRTPAPRPLFSKLNLTTVVDTVQFNPTGELLVFGSSGKKDSMRVLHVAGQKVFSNWPTQNTPISYLRTATFDGTGQYLALGNEKGVATLWELGFYRNVQTDELPTIEN
jgi:U3 small nucleolar RNA-associated protein 18